MTDSEDFEIALNIMGRFERGDHLIGLMDGSETGIMVECFQKAGRAGNALAWSQLGECYVRGLGVEPDPEKAVEALGKAHELSGNPGILHDMLKTAYHNRIDSLTDSRIQEYMGELEDLDVFGEEFLLKGYMLYAGYGFEQDSKASFKAHMTAAEKGNAKAMFELSVYYTQGIGVEADGGRALQWCRDAADHGSVRGMYNLGTAYAAGRDTERNSEKAVQWYARAAEEGHGRAAATLAVMYLDGTEIPGDPEKARDYYELAEENGFDTDAFFQAMGRTLPEWDD